jgi:two-component system chemotaxis response regulator CheY
MSKVILCVDDSASIRQMVKLTLSGAGYQVVQANDGAEGLSKARESTVNLVVTDLNMPVMNGLGSVSP